MKKIYIVTVMFITIATTFYSNSVKSQILNLTYTVSQLPINPVSLGNDTAICIGNSISLNAGNPGSTYLWSDNSTNQQLTVLMAGVYSVTVTHANGCTAIDTISITNHSVITANFTDTEVLCYGSSTGSVNLNVSGGVPNYTYNWSNGSISQNITNVPVGLYTVTITDGAGCSLISSHSVQGPQSIQINLATTNATCGNSNGTATVSVAGGILPYNILWSNGKDSTTITGLSSGIYMVQITDANSCSSFSIATINNTNGPLINVDGVTDVSCFGGQNGAINISVSSGTPPYTYSWSNGSINQDINGLQHGPYEVAVHDNAGCVSILSITVNQPQQISLNYSSTPASCGLSDGSVSVAPNGGTAPYNFIWSVGQTTATILAVPAGVYFCSVLDDHGCVGGPGTGVVVSNAGAPEIEIDSIISPSCAANNGSVNITVSMGTPPYTYLWSNAFTSEDISGLSTGTYSVTVQDAGGCMGMASLIVEETLPAVQPICIITVDSLTNRNLLVWEKVQTIGISHYNIYRESSMMGIYQNIAVVPFDSLSIYLDSVANPLVHSWRYKISAVDSCGNESILSQNHKTIHLTISSGLGGTYNLNWDDYEGFSFLSFEVTRYSSTNGSEIIDVLPANVHSYTDFAPIAGTLWYSVSVLKPGNPCMGTKAQGGPYAHAHSNMEDVQMVLDLTENDENNGFIIYPNPFTQNATISFSTSILTSDKAEISIIDISGKIVQKIKLSDNYKVLQSNTLVDIDRDGLKPGIYFVELKANKVYRGKIIVQ